MGKRNKSFKGDLDQRAIDWFHQIDDQVPFDAFGDVNKEHLIGTEIFSNVNRKINQPKSLKLVFIRAAAAILLVASLGIVLYATDRIPGVSNAESWTTYSSQLGETKTITLADRSVVVLRPGTKLYVPATFTSDDKRIVKLEGGEAYFSVTHNPKRPFIVQSGKISTQVLGTAFNINNDVALDQIEVAVSHGKVQVNDQTHRLAYLTKGKLIRFNTRSGNFKLDSINTNYVAAWNSATVDLNNVAFKELAYVFNSCYGTELVAADAEIEKLRYTLTINKTADAQGILKIIAKIHGLFIKEQNGKIILYR